MNTDKRFYEIACSFPSMKWKGVENGDIPGIEADRFCPDDLYHFLENGGRAWSGGEVLVLEFLLNLYSPGTYPGFNFGRAVNVWDGKHMQACMAAVVRIFNGN